MRYLLDATVLIDHANGDEPATALLARLFEGGHVLYTCDIATCEALSRGDDDDVRHIKVLLDALEFVETTPTAARWAGESRRQGRAAGTRRAMADALIAGVAMDLQATIVTRNGADFARQGVPVLGY